MATRVASAGHSWASLEWSRALPAEASVWSGNSTATAKGWLPLEARTCPQNFLMNLRDYGSGPCSCVNDAAGAGRVGTPCILISALPRALLSAVVVDDEDVRVGGADEPCGQ